MGDTSIKQFIDYAFDTFLAKTGEKLYITGAKDGTLVKRLLRVYDLDKLKSLWDIFLKQDDDPFISQAGFSIGIFSSQINKLIMLQRKYKPRKVQNEYQPLTEPEEGRIDPKEIRKLIKEVSEK